MINIYINNFIVKTFIILLVFVLAIVTLPKVRNYLHNKSATRPLYVYKSDDFTKNKILLLHGLTGSHSYWDNIIPKLEKGFSVIAPDLIGFGKSPWPSGPYSIQHHLKLLKRIISNEEVILIGHSMGSLLALKFAEYYPDNVSKMILLSPPSIESRKELKHILSEQSKIESIMALDTFWAPFLCHIHEFLGPLSYYFYRPMIDEFLPDKVVKSGIQHRWESYDKSLRNVVLKVNAVSELQVTTKPYSVLVGSSDGYSKNEQLFKEVKNVKKFPGGHNFLWEGEEAINFILEQISNFRK